MNAINYSGRPETMAVKVITGQTGNPFNGVLCPQGKGLAGMCSHVRVPSFCVPHTGLTFWSRVSLLVGALRDLTVSLVEAHTSWLRLSTALGPAGGWVWSHSGLGGTPPERWCQLGALCSPGQKRARWPVPALQPRSTWRTDCSSAGGETRPGLPEQTSWSPPTEWGPSGRWAHTPRKWGTREGLWMQRRW